MIIFLITFSQKKYRIIVISGLYSVFISTLLFVVKRPGISDSFLGYKTSGPDQFFYTQNLIMWFLLIFVLAQIKMSNGLKIVISGCMILMIAVSLPLISTYSNNDFMAKNVGTIDQNVKESCAKSIGEDVSVQIYPEKGDTWKITSKRSTVCGKCEMKNKIVNLLNNDHISGQAVRYIVMASIAVTCELGIFWFINSILKINYLAATVLSVMVAIVINWIGSKYYVFKTGRLGALHEFITVFIASLVGMLIQVLTIYILVSRFHMIPIVGKILAIIVAFAWNFFIRRVYIFKPK